MRSLDDAKSWKKVTGTNRRRQCWGQDMAKTAASMLPSRSKETNSSTQIWNLDCTWGTVPASVGSTVRQCACC